MNIIEEIERERLSYLEDMLVGYAPKTPAQNVIEMMMEQVEKSYAPGTFGHHELLDRVSLVGNLVEVELLHHAACLLNSQYYTLARVAVDALRELYQLVGTTGGSESTEEEAALLAGLDSGEPIEADAAYWEQKKRELRGEP